MGAHLLEELSFLPHCILYPADPVGLAQLPFLLEVSPGIPWASVHSPLLTNQLASLQGRSVHPPNHDTNLLSWRSLRYKRKKKNPHKRTKEKKVGYVSGKGESGFRGISQKESKAEGELGLCVRLEPGTKKGLAHAAAHVQISGSVLTLIAVSSTFSLVLSLQHAGFLSFLKHALSPHPSPITSCLAATDQYCSGLTGNSNEELIVLGSGVHSWSNQQSHLGP